jgi:hypothetical protein
MEIPKIWTVLRTSLGTKDRREIREIKGQTDERIVNRDGKVTFCHFGVSRSRAVMLRSEYQWMKNLGYDYTKHPDSCGADAENDPEEELTELEGDTLWSQD